MTPAFSILADGLDVTARIAGRKHALTIADKSGMEADELTLEIVDPHRDTPLPRRGAILEAAIGWEGRPLTPKGAFRVDQVGHKGPPDTIVIKGRSADFTGALKAQRDTSYHDSTLGDVLQELAGRHGLAPAIEAGLAALPIPHLDQTGESDGNLLARLGIDFDAVATIKAGRLIFLPRGHDAGTGGTPLPLVKIDRTEVVSHEWEIADRQGSTTGVRAKSRDFKAAQSIYYTAGDTVGPVKMLRRNYPTEGAAKAAADAELGRIVRGSIDLNLSLARGRAEIIPNQKIELTGWREEINTVRYVVTEVTHRIDENGFLTALRAEGDAMA